MIKDWYLVLLILAVSATAATAVVSTDASPLPGSLAKMMSSLDKEYGCTSFCTACLMTSRGVTRKQKSALVASLAGEASESDLLSKQVVLGTSSGLVIACPQTPIDAAASACACGGTIVYYPDPVDLARGEGLFDSLAPAIESILTVSDKGTALIIVVPPSGNVDTTKSLMEKAVAGMINNLSAEKAATSLTDLFDKVMYVPFSEATPALLEAAAGEKISMADATTRVREAADSMADDLEDNLSAAELAAVRKLAPASRLCLAKAVDQVQQLCRDEAKGTPKLVVNFGELCDAAVQQALDSFEEAVGQDNTRLLSTTASRQIRSSLLTEIENELSVLFEEQMEQLKLASFEQLKKSFSKLLVSPNLGSDMDEQSKTAISDFAKAAKKMVSKSCSTFSAEPALNQFRRTVKDYVKKRLQTARASGQYRPLPRKGVTVGLHWLLPKPFGNDYRQEPWMVHATDNMVYIPKDKVTDVSPEEVAAGDWRRKIVPSPVGNDMLYMQ